MPRSVTGGSSNRRSRRAPFSAEVIASAGIVSAMFNRSDDAIGYLRRAVEIDLNRAHAQAVLGWQICLRHSGAHGLNYIESSERRAPHNPRIGLLARIFHHMA